MIRLADVARIILSYYRLLGLKTPDAWRALAFANTELAEVYELLISREGGWARNNPQNKPSWSKEKYGEELGDMLMMVIVAGLVEGVNPVESLIAKLERKLKERGVLHRDDSLENHTLLM